MRLIGDPLLIIGWSSDFAGQDSLYGWDWSGRPSGLRARTPVVQEVLDRRLNDLRAFDSILAVADLLVDTKEVIPVCSISVQARTGSLLLSASAQLRKGSLLPRPFQIKGSGPGKRIPFNLIMQLLH